MHVLCVCVCVWEGRDVPILWQRLVAMSSPLVPVGVHMKVSNWQSCNEHIPHTFTSDSSFTHTTHTHSLHSHSTTSPSHTHTHSLHSHSTTSPSHTHTHHTPHTYTENVLSSDYLNIEGKWNL